LVRRLCQEPRRKGIGERGTWDEPHRRKRKNRHGEQNSARTLFPIRLLFFLIPKLLVLVVPVLVPVLALVLVLTLVDGGELRY